MHQIAELFQWANNDSFWKSNILCPDTLRKQWDKLIIQKQNKPNQSPVRKMSLGERATKARKDCEQRYINKHQIDLKLI